MNKKNNVIIFHAHDDMPEKHWYPWLATELQAIGVETTIPEFPLRENQTPEKWLEVFESLKDSINENTILVGHSLGAAMVLHVLSVLEIRVAGIVLLGGFGKEFGSDPIDLVCNKFVENLSWKKIQERAGTIKIFVSTNDPVIPQDVSIDLGIALKSPIHFIEKAGHFCLKDGFEKIPFLFDYLKSQIFVSYDEFKKMDIRVGTVLAVEPVPDTDKLLKCTLDFGEVNEAGEPTPRTIVSGIREYYPEYEQLVGKQLLYIVNLEPRMIKGIESQGMLLAVGEGAPTMLVPEQPTPAGARIR